MTLGQRPKQNARAESQRAPILALGYAGSLARARLPAQAYSSAGLKKVGEMEHILSMPDSEG